MKWSLSEIKLSVTKLSEKLDETPGRVAQWVRAERGVSSSLCWTVGETLRSSGARTSGVQALWAAGYFDDLVLLLGHVAGELFGTALYRDILLDTYLALPNAMLAFESLICYELGFTNGLQDEKFFETYDSPDWLLGQFVNCDAKSMHDNLAPEGWWVQNEYDPLELAVGTLNDASTREALQKAWIAVIRGAHLPKVRQRSTNQYVDYDLLSAIETVAKQWMNKRFPSIVGAHVWRLMSEFICAAVGTADVQYLPYPYLPQSLEWSTKVVHLDLLNRDYIREQEREKRKARKAQRGKTK